MKLEEGDYVNRLVLSGDLSCFLAIPATVAVSDMQSDCKRLLCNSVVQSTVPMMTRFVPAAVLPHVEIIAPCHSYFCQNLWHLCF